MKKRIGTFGAAHRALFLLTASVPTILLAQEVVAQQITSGVRGVVNDPSGSPAANVQVIVTDTRTGRATTTTTNAQGRFSVSGLQVGGPYHVFVDSDRFADQRVEDVFLSVASAADLRVQLTVEEALEEIVVTGARTVMSKLAIGPSAAFGLETLENLPSIERDIRDTIRIDPRITIEDTRDDSIQCLGGNNRFNAFTIDGVRNADSFGLNASGFPARNNLPIPFDAIRETSVEFAPYSVEFGQFTGCNINVVTKSGSNEIHGSAFFVMDGDGITGKRLEGDEVRTEEFRDWEWGAEFGFPVLRDKLFLYFAYNQEEESDTQDSGPIGAGFANEQFITVEDANRISDILKTSFGRDPLGFARSLDETNRRFLIRADWFISDRHRLAATFTSIDEENIEPDDFGFNGFAFQDNFENEGSDIETWSLRLFSDWTDNLSTEIRLSRIDNLDKQNPIGGGEAQSGNPKPRIIVQGPGGGDIAISGPGFFRAANQLDTQIDQIKAKATYSRGNHSFTAGYELDQLDVFNLFVPDSTGTIEFASIEDLTAGKASFVTAQSSFTGDVNDAAAVFSRAIHSLYLQDEWQATPELLITLGLRGDFFTSGDGTPFNPDVEARYGFSNTDVFDGLNVIMPRLGINYNAPWEFFGRTTFRAGAGVFSGGDPTVWFSNAFVNFGGAIGQTNSAAAGCTDEELQVLDASGNFTGVPQCVLLAAQQQALANNGPIDLIDPDFDLPSIVRGSFGFTHTTDFGGAAGGFFDDWDINMDVIVTKRRNAPDVIDISLTQIGTAPDGRPIFNRVDPLLPGCDAVFLGPRQGFSGNTQEGGPCDTGRDTNQDTLLTNVVGDNGGSVSFSTQFSKEFNYDLFNRPGSFNLNVGYAFTKAQDRNPTTSSTAGSNVEEVALSVVNHAPLANSPFVNRHNVTMSAIFENDWWSDYTTTFGFFFQAREGVPFSFTFDDRTTENLFGDSDNESRQLLYVPTGPDDPLADFSQLSQEDIDAFFAFIERIGLDKFAGSIAPRNAFRDPWFTDFDMRFSQEFPGFRRNDRFEFSVNIDNLLNLINGNANILRRFNRGDVGEAVPLAGATLNEDGTKFVFTSVAGGRPGDDVRTGGGGDINRVVDASIWRVQIGMKYRF